MSKRARQYIGILAAVVAYYVIHEGAHLVYALITGTFKRINLMTLGVQVDVFAERMSDTQLGVFCLAGAVATFAAAYVLVLLAGRIAKAKSKLLRAVVYYITVALLLLDPLYLSLLCGLFGGDMNGIALLVPELAARLGFGVFKACAAGVQLLVFRGRSRGDKMMEYPIERLVPYPIAALCVLLLFYGVYVAKLWALKRHGINGRQIGKRKERDIHTVELLMSVATVGIIPAQLLSIALGWSLLPDGARFTGLCLGLLGDLLFCAAALRMRDSWRAGIPQEDRTELVTDGIYAYSRNPAFLGFDLQYAGVLLMYCNPLTLAFSAFAVVTLHLQILQEERYLVSTLGAPYLDYKRRVFRYLGRRKRKNDKSQ